MHLTRLNPSLAREQKNKVRFTRVYKVAGRLNHIELELFFLLLPLHGFEVPWMDLSLLFLYSLSVTVCVQDIAGRLDAIRLGILWNNPTSEAELGGKAG